MSRTNFQEVYTSGASRYILDNVRQPKDKLLSVKFDLDTLARFYAALELKRPRTVSEHIHSIAYDTINEIAGLVDKDEFERVYQAKRKEIQERSKQKSKERKASEKKKIQIGGADTDDATPLDNKQPNNNPPSSHDKKAAHLASPDTPPQPPPTTPMKKLTAYSSKKQKKTRNG